MALRHGLHAATILPFLLALTGLLRLSYAFEHVPNSPCASTCADGTLTKDAVCLDAEYKSTQGGRDLQTCVGCLLNSTAVDTTKNETDVEYGLLALRYTLSSCMFGIPEERVSISSPCQVTCAPLNASIGYQLTNTTNLQNAKLDFCTAAPFEDTRINNCAFCYSFIPQQLFLANFLQALHITCRDPPAMGEPFFPDAQTLFNETLIAGPAPPSKGTGGGGGLHGSSLAVAIALPIVGGVLIISGLCWCCFVFTRKRRRRMAASGRMERVHEQQEATMYSPITPKAMWGEAEPPREMSHLSPQGKGISPPTANERWTQHYPGQAVAAQEDDGTPLRNSFQRDDVGPGAGQLQDPNLHEQYFGVADGGEDLPGPSNTGLGLYDETRASAHSAGVGHTPPTREDERGHWVQ